MFAQTLATTPQEREADSSLHQFAADVWEGLRAPQGSKMLSPRYLYDDLGSALFDAITVVPEYGLTRADQRLLSAHASEIAQHCGSLTAVAELGSGSGKKTTDILRAARGANSSLLYLPIDVSSAALHACEREIGELCPVTPVCADWMEGLQQVAAKRSGMRPLLLLFLGSSIGNLDRALLPEFLGSIQRCLRPGDFFLLGADLVKDVPTMLTAYDDPAGVTAAFNLNLLGRLNRELGCNFQLRGFRHEARWNQSERRIEMHLVSLCEQVVEFPPFGTRFYFAKGESLWTESSHKFDREELHRLAGQSGFIPQGEWIDHEWPFMEALWKVA